jgi:hypothetical protein
VDHGGGNRRVRNLCSCPAYQPGPPFAIAGHRPIALMLPQSIQVRWQSVFLRWRLRRAIVLAVAVRLILSALLLYANGERGTRSFTLTGIDTSLYVIALTIAVAVIDMRRSGANDLMANLGYSGGELVSLMAIPPVLLEIGINFAVAIA